MEQGYRTGRKLKQQKRFTITCILLGLVAILNDLVLNIVAALPILTHEVKLIVVLQNLLAAV